MDALYKNYYKTKTKEQKMKFALLDPRPVGKETNEQLLSENNCLGIEVTIPYLAAGCKLGNIDPQHSNKNSQLSAIEVAVNCELPPENATLVTVRADLDSVGSMALIKMRSERQEISFETLSRVQEIADFDKFSNGGWPGVRPIPSLKNPWPNARENSLSAINQAVMDFKVSLEQRVALIETWLLTGQEPVNYRELADKARSSMISALEAGQITYELNGDVAVVTSTHMAGTAIGYCLSPVIVVYNPEFRFQGGEPHKKFTIAQFTPGHVDLKKSLEEISGLETGWGGSPTIIGSPQGVSSTLSLETVVEIVEKHKISNI